MIPSAFDEAGMRMLDSIREIFDILNIEFGSIRFDLIKYNNHEELSYAIRIGKCPVVDILREYIYPFQPKGGSTALVATGIKKENDIDRIQLKNSYADDPNEPGKFIIDLKHKNNFYLQMFLNFTQMFSTCHINEV